MARAEKLKTADRPRGKRGRSNPVDGYVGSRVRQRRTLLGLSQEKLGDALHLTFQQVQKYERGANRIGASRLYQISQILDVPVAYFFDEMPDTVEWQPGVPVKTLAEGHEQFDHDPMAKRETLELVRAYYKITDPRVRRRVFELVKALAKSSQG